MVRHLVLFKMKTFSQNNEKNEATEKLVAALKELPSKIDVIKFYEIGENQKDSPAAYDIGLNSAFETWNDLQEYAKHPEHIKVVELVNELTSNRVVTDYEY